MTGSQRPGRQAWREGQKAPLDLLTQHPLPLLSTAGPQFLGVSFVMQVASVKTFNLRSQILLCQPVGHLSHWELLSLVPGYSLTCVLAVQRTERDRDCFPNSLPPPMSSSCPPLPSAPSPQSRSNATSGVEASPKERTEEAYGAPPGLGVTGSGLLPRVSKAIIQPQSFTGYYGNCQLSRPDGER